MEITISAKNAEDLRDKVLDLGRVFGLGIERVEIDPKQMSFPKEALESKNMTPEEAVEKAEKVVATAKKNAVPEAQKKEAAPEPSEEKAQSEEPTGTPEDARAALELLNEKKGLEAARKVLAQFECRRLSELKPKDYGPFIDACRS